MEDKIEEMGNGREMERIEKGESVGDGRESERWRKEKEDEKKEETM